MVSTSLKFGGKIIEELSQKIPSSLFALNELVKNSYDAFSPDVTITVIPSELKIIISDYGNGMSVDEIHSLFHISKSTKKIWLRSKSEWNKENCSRFKRTGFFISL